MNTEPDSVVLDILRKIQADMAAVRHDIRELKTGQGRVERELNSLRGDLLRQAETIAVLDFRIERIETRLELRDS
jgi:hypothetical protein